METITSRTNPLCTHLRKLSSSASYRRECGEFVCDSPKLLEEALLWQGAVHTVISTDSIPLPTLPAGVRHVRVPADVMRAVSPAQAPQGALAVCGIPERTLPEILDGRRYVVLDGVQDPGNVGTILRTADAFQADGVFLLPGCADLYNPKTVRASMGAVFRRPPQSAPMEDVLRVCHAAGIPIAATALSDTACDLREVDLMRHLVVIGSEGQGICPELLAASDRQIIIPMQPRCESLNAAVAAAIVLWQMRP